MKTTSISSITLLLILAPAGGALLASPVEEDPAARFAAALANLRQIVEEPDSCLPESRSCEKFRARLQVKTARAVEAGTDAQRMKLIAGALKNSKPFNDSVFAAEWLDRFAAAAQEIFLAGEAIVEREIDSLEEMLDVYGSPLERFGRRSASLVRKKQRADDRRGDGSLRSSAAYLKKIGAVHQAAGKLLVSIESYIDAIDLVVLPESDFSVLLYENPLAAPEDGEGWVMEGPGEIEFRDGWMEVRDPRRAGHHVLWCPEEFPADFAAEWELQNLDTRAGLLISFFAARGRSGVDIFDPSLRRRTGDFENYTKGDIDNYHISYYANNPNNRGRENSRLRKNRGFKLVQTGEPGVPDDSEAIHTIRLVKDKDRIKMFVDGRKIIDYTDLSDPHGGGKIGFRQMQWSHFRYRNLRVFGAAAP